MEELQAAEEEEKNQDGSEKRSPRAGGKRKLETDIFQKDIPIYISRRSCHPLATFSAVARAWPPS